MSARSESQTSSGSSTSSSSEESKPRYKEINESTEWIERYEPGGFHPIHIGDFLKGSRYKILRKLGYGSYSTVWLAKDHQSGYVAIKILIANDDTSQNEVATLKALSASPVHHPGRSNIVTLLDNFELLGPNGTHICLVFDVMGPSATALSRSSLLNRQSESRSSVDRSFPLWMAKSMLRQVLQGIDFMHQNQIAHGDVHPGNILFGLQDLRSVDEDSLMQDMTPRDPTNFAKEAGISEPVRALESEAEKSAPRYLAMNQPLNDFLSLDHQFIVKISDLGAASPFSKPCAEPLTPVALRSPECICGAPAGSNQDIWSFGCLIYEFLTGHHLFTLFGYDEDEEANDEHLIQFSYILGPLSPDLLVKWSRSSHHFDSEGKPRGVTQNIEREDEATKVEPLDVQIGAVEAGLKSLPTIDLAHHESNEEFREIENSNEGKDDHIDEDPVYLCLEDMFRRHKSPDVDEAEASIITTLIRSALHYDPKKRPSTSQLLEHPWFAESS